MSAVKQVFLIYLISLGGKIHVKMGLFGNFLRFEPSVLKKNFFKPGLGRIRPELPGGEN